MSPRPPISTLFPYTTLFRSFRDGGRGHVRHLRGDVFLVPEDVRPHDERDAGQVALLARSEEHTSELQSHSDLVCRLLLEKKKRVRPYREDERLVTLQQYDDL